jgi:hypothetical protein
MRAANWLAQGLVLRRFKRKLSFILSFRRREKKTKEI